MVECQLAIFDMQVAERKLWYPPSCWMCRKLQFWTQLWWRCAQKSARQSHLWQIHTYLCVSWDMRWALAYFSLSLSLAICLFLSLVLPQQYIMRFGCLSLSLWQVTKDTPAVAWFPADSSMGEAGSLGIKWLRQNTLVMKNCQRHSLVSHQTPI